MRNYYGPIQGDSCKVAKKKMHPFLFWHEEVCYLWLKTREERIADLQHLWKTYKMFLQSQIKLVINFADW